MRRAVVGHVTALVQFAGTLLALDAAGAPVTGWMRARGGGAAVRLALGLGVLAVLLHGLGLAGLWTPGVLRAVTLIAAVIGGLRLITRPPRLDRALIAAVAVPLLLGFVVSRLPDTDDDPRTYHFAAPESYLREHRIHAEPLNVNWHMPLGASMLFGAGWAWGDAEGAKLVNLAALLALMLGTARLAEVLAPGAGAAAALLAGSTGLGVGQVWQGKDDLVLAVPCALAAWAGVTGRWSVALLLLGQAVAVKFTAGFFGAGLLLLAVLPFRRNRLRVLPLGVLPVAGWLAASWLFVGNPVHPFLSSVFPDLGWGPEYQQALHRVMAILTGAGDLGLLEAARDAWRAWGDPALGHPALPVLAAAGLVLIRHPARWRLLAVVVAGFALWLATERNPRYLFPFAAILAACGGVAMAWLRPRLGLAAILLSCAVLLLPVGTALRLVSRDGLPLLTGRLDRDAYLARRFTTWDAMRRWANAELPRRSTLIFAGEERRLWFTARVRSGFTVHEPLLWRWSRDAATPGRMRVKARQANASAVVHNYMSAEFRSLTRYPGPDWTDRQLGVYREFAARWLRPVRLPDRMDRDGGGFIVSRLQSAPPGERWPVFHLPQAEGLGARPWELASRGDRAGAAAERRRIAARLEGVMVARLHLGFAAELEHDDAGVVRALAPAIAAGFIGVNALERYGSAALATGRIREGLAAISRAWRMSREDSLLVPYAYGLYQRALGHLKAGRKARAREDLLVAAFLAPEQPAIRRALAALSAR